MKADRYRELFSEIDTDRFTDEKIKNKLLNHQLNEGNQLNKDRNKKSYHSRVRYSLSYLFTGFTVVKHALPSLTFLMFLIIAVFAVRHQFFNETVTHSSESVISEDTTASTKPDSVVEKGEFYYAVFDIIADSKVKKSIPNLIIRFHGAVDNIDPADLTDIVLTKDGIAVDNKITLTDKVVQALLGYERFTDFYFHFDLENKEPGVYGLTGKYRGVPFTVYEEILEESVSEEPADSEDFLAASYSGYADRMKDFREITAIIFTFTGLQNSFYPSDLTEMKITLNNAEIPFLFDGTVTRYYEVVDKDSTETWFSLDLKEALSEPGTYIITGKYQGKPFTYWEDIIP